MTKIIKCNVHDYFEIACMHRSQITLTLDNGKTVQGHAIDLVTKNKNEFIHLLTAEKIEKHINLLEIDTLKIKGSEELIYIS